MYLYCFASLVSVTVCQVRWYEYHSHSNRYSLRSQSPVALGFPVASLSRENLSYCLTLPIAMIPFPKHPHIPYVQSYFLFVRLLSFYCSGIVTLFLSIRQSVFQMYFHIYFVNFRIGVYFPLPNIYCKYSRGTPPTLFFKLTGKFKNDRVSNHSAIL